MKYLNKALDIQLKKLGNDHSRVATSYSNIGLVYADQDKHDEALEYFNKALDIRLKIFGKDHPLVATSYNNIGSVYNAQGKLNEALKYFNKALDNYDLFLIFS